MLDRQAESLYHPQRTLVPAEMGRVLCIAPHPDDEILGAGGLLALLAQAGNAPELLILTRGDCASGEASKVMAEVRTAESCRAAAILGLPAPRFLDWPDRGLRYGTALIDCLQAALDECAPDWVLLPSLSEPHPDHQALALAGLAAAQRRPSPPGLLFYEVGAPMHPNSRIDIGAVAERKWRAIREFASQEAIQPYEAHARALATLRAFGMGCSAAEAYFQVEPQVLSEQGAGAALPWWPLVRSRQDLANSPDQLPMVSILIRSMDRPHLTQAVASMVSQTYPNLEVVILNASGRLHGPVPIAPGWMPVRLVEPEVDGTGKPQVCGRSRAANLALAAARGTLAMFLDDDDLVQPGHVEKLVAALQRHPAAPAAYSGVRVEGGGGQFLRDYDLPWSRHRLDAINFLPIHAVLFRLDRVRDIGLAFDEGLPVLEDWQFWRGLAACGDFVHCPGISALYRQTHGMSGVGDPGHPNHWQRWHRLLLERSMSGSSPADIAASLAWHAVQLDQLTVSQQRREVMLAELEQLGARALIAEHELQQSEAALRQGRDDALAESGEMLDCQRQVGELERALDLCQREIAMMKRSRSWWLTQPLRVLSGWWRGAGA